MGGMQYPPFFYVFFLKVAVLFEPHFDFFIIRRNIYGQVDAVCP